MKGNFSLTSNGNNPGLRKSSYSCILEYLTKKRVQLQSKCGGLVLFWCSAQLLKCPKPHVMSRYCQNPNTDAGYNNTGAGHMRQCGSPLSTHGLVYAAYLLLQNLALQLKKKKKKNIEKVDPTICAGDGVVKGRWGRILRE